MLSQLHSLGVSMIEVVDLDLLYSFFPLEFRFRLVLGQFRFARKIVEFIVLTRYLIRYVATDERLKFTGDIGSLFTRAVCSHFGVVRTLSLLQFYLVHSVVLAAVHVSWSFPSETAPERSRLRVF